MWLPSYTTRPDWMLPKKKIKLKTIKKKKKINIPTIHVGPVQRHIINTEIMLPSPRPDHKSPVSPSTALAATQAVLWSHRENIEFCLHHMKGGK